MSEPAAPRVSVVIPAYNQAQYLAGCLRSVQAQTFSEYEIIVVDDGSTDETSQVASEFGAAIRYVWQENQGLAGARNTGIRLAQGELVALLDSDDEWLPEYLDEMLRLADQHPQAAVFYCPVEYMDPHGQQLPQRSKAFGIHSQELYWKLLRANFLVPSTILMRREAACVAGLFDPAFRRLQDWELWLRMLRAGYEFVEAPQHLVRYRLHDASLSTDPSGGQRAARAMVEKLFGPEDQAPLESWPADKRRAFGGMYRYHALSSVQYQADWQACAAYLERGWQADPSLAEDVDLFYELALGTQPVGFRGVGAGVEVEANALALQAALSNLPPSTLRQKAQGTAYQAAGSLAYNLGLSNSSRRLLGQAFLQQPGLWRQRKAAGMYLKSWLGGTALARLRRWRGAGRA